jgi:tRNA U34 5-carboxymethylaminomethyl modifying GTPase MnmE/TrmE
LPVVALVGYTNAGKSTLLNRLSSAGVLAEDMLFATLDPTTRKCHIPRGKTGAKIGIDEDDEARRFTKGQEILLTDTVGFISKLPTDLIAAFRATLEEVKDADVLIHVCDRSSPVWQKQRETVMRELSSIGCSSTPIVELWNKIDLMTDPNSTMIEAVSLPIDVDIYDNLGNASETAFLDESDRGSVWNEDDVYITEEAERKSVALPSIPILSLAPKLSKFKRKHYTVASSIKTGLGFDDFMATLEVLFKLFCDRILPILILISMIRSNSLIFFSISCYTHFDRMH